MGYTPCHQPMSKSVSLDVRVNRQLESRMREIRQSGSEGGGAQTNAPSLPLSISYDLRSLNLNIFHLRHLTRVIHWCNIKPWMTHG